EVRETLRKDSSLDASRTALDLLSAVLANATENRPAPLSTEERDRLRRDCRLSDDDLADVARDTFNTLDAHYLADCLLVRDALESVCPEKAPAASDPQAARKQLRRASDAFAWAVRQVWMHEQPTPALPPAVTLRFGSGTVADRAEVALALFRQLGLDGCRVGR